MTSFFSIRERVPLVCALLLALLGTLGICTTLSADDEAPDEGDEIAATERAPQKKKREKPALDEDTISSPLDLPSTLPNGRHLRSVGIYDSQKFELIPKGYRAVRTQALVDAIEDWNESSLDREKGHLKSATFWIEWSDGKLVSPRSFIEVETLQDGWVSQSLGKVNFSVDLKENSHASSGESSPRLMSGADGELFAFFQAKESGQTQVEFAWQLAGQPTGRGHEFEIKIPRTPQSRLVFSIPPGHRLESSQGVLRSLPDAPSDASLESDGSPALAQEDFHWYEMDAGGRDTVRLQVLSERSDSAGEAIVLRRSSVEYTIDPSGLFFLQRMELGVPVGSELPQLGVQGATITSAKINASEANLVEVTNASNHSRQYQIITPPGTIDRKDIGVSITVMGQAKWSDVCDLPLVGLLLDSRSSHQLTDASIEDEVRVAVADSMGWVDWKLPLRWTHQANKGTNTDGFHVKTSQGPSLQSEFRQHWQEASSWSQIRLTTPAAYRVRDLWLRAKVRDANVTSDALVDIQMNVEQLQPIKLEIQQGWEVKSVQYASSARIIDPPTASPATLGSPTDVPDQVITLWPEVSDIELTQNEVGETISVLRVRISGIRSLPSSSTRMQVPPCWFVRIRGNDGKTLSPDHFTAALIPPTDMNWKGETAMLPDQINESELTKKQKRFLTKQNQNTLYFQPSLAQIPSVGLETPSVDYGANLLMEITTANGEIYEKLTVNLASSGRNIDQLVVHTGASEGRPELRWLIPDKNGSPSISLAASDVELMDEERQGIYTLNVAGRNLADHPLVARRHYPTRNLTLQLPSIPRATSGRAEVFVESGLEIRRKDKSVQLIPRLPTPVSASPRTGSRASSGEPTTARGIPDGDHVSGGDSLALAYRMGTDLRYDAAKQPSIDLAMAQGDSSVNVIADAYVRVGASSRGTDRIEAIYQASLANPLVIQYEPALQIASVERDGESINITNLSTRPLVLPVRQDIVMGTPETIRVVWYRAHSGFRVVRKCRIPMFEMNAAILQNAYQLAPSPDTFAPVSLLRGNASSDSLRVIKMVPGDVATLVRRNVALAVGWLLSLLMFSSSWVLMRRSPLALLILLAVLGVVMLLWWPWRLAVIGWFILPVIAAALLVSSQAWNGKENWLENDVQENRKRSKRILKPSAEVSDHSTDFSWQSVLRGCVLAVLTAWALTSTAMAQKADSSDRSISRTEKGRQAIAGDARTDDDGSGTGAVNVMVPMDSGFKPVGNFVYVPGTLHEKLFPRRVQVTSQQPRFMDAEYLLKISESNLPDGVGASAVVEAEYWIDVSRESGETTRIALPIEHDLVEQIQLVGDDHRIIRSSPDADGHTVITLPEGDRFRLRLTLKPKASREGQWIRFHLKIPPIVTSRLQVESEINLQVLRVGGQEGRLMTETDLRRWVDSLGPTGELQVDFRRDSRSTPISNAAEKPLQRRYWVSAGEEKVTIDCEVDPPEAVAAGERFQFVVRDAAMPILMSPDWRLSGSDLYATNRRLVSVTSVRDRPGPIHLLWAFPRKSLSGSRTSHPRNLPRVVGPKKDPLKIQIPEVIAASLGETAPAWIALHCSDSLAFSPLPRDSIEPLSVDQFLAGWSGYRGRIGRAIVALNGMPTPVLNPLLPPSGQVELRHQLRVSPHGLELQFEADLKVGETPMGSYLLSLPKTINLVNLFINEQRVDPVSFESADQRHVLITPPKVSSEKVPREKEQEAALRITALAVGEFPLSGPFTPPMMTLSHPSPSQGTGANQEPLRHQDFKHLATYTVLRTLDSVIQIVEPFKVDSVRTTEAVTTPVLGDGYLPVATWQVQESGLNLDPWGGLFRVSSRSTRFDCDQTIVMERKEGAWKAISQIRFLDDQIPDYVDVEVPGRWNESLQVTPKTVWFRKASTSDTKEVIRIRCDRDQEKDGSLTITGNLRQSDSGRVTVPNIRVLGSGERNVFIQVPQRLINDQVSWRTSGVEASRRPASLAAMPTEDRKKVTPKDWQWFRTSRKAWFVELAPLPELRLRPLSITQDNQVFVTSEGFFVLSHWDLSPGTLDSLAVRMPSDAQCLGGWSGGRAVDTSVTSSISDTGIESPVLNKEKVVKIPLSLSQLPQTVKLLIHVPASVSKRNDYIPELISVPVTQSWLAVHQPREPGTPAVDPSMVDERQMRNLSLARSVVDSVEIAVDLVAERSSGEVAAWLKPWVERYLDLAKSSGREVGFSRPALSAAASLENHSSEGTETKLRQVQWNALDDRIAVYAQRYLKGFSAGDAPLASPTASLMSQGRTVGPDQSIFSDSQFRNFRLDLVKRLPSASHTVELRPISTKDQRLKHVIGNAITMILVGGTLICLRPLRKWVLPVLVHPAFWLACLGATALVVAPIYVAGSLMLVALCTTVLPAKSKAS